MKNETKLPVNPSDKYTINFINIYNLCFTNATVFDAHKVSDCFHFVWVQH